MPKAQRRLAAIVAADIAGYSRLVAADEEATVNALRSHRRDIIDPKIAEYSGRIANTAGDSLLIEFPSVVDAVRCAIDVQEEMTAQNTAVPQDRRIEFRVGVNLGDVIAEGDDLLGDGVNVAARLQALAAPGGICISRAARDQIRDRLDIGLDDMGEVEVKNIPRPVRVFRVSPDGQIPRSKPRPRLTGQWWLAVAAAIFLLVIAGGGWLWWQQPDFEPADPAKMAYALPDTPSIAVLPFANTSGDPEQEYFADGITDDLTTDLSKLPGLFVISRNSAFAYKGKVVKIREVAENLGVRYVLEGSVRRVGDHVRLNTQLTDAISGGNVWAERYDRQLDSIFAVQDAITSRVVQALKLELTNAKASPDDKKAATSSLEAYDWVLKARKQLTRFDHDEAAKAKVLLERAIELDPSYVEAHSLLGLYFFDEWRLWGTGRDKNLARALDIAGTAAQLNPSDPAPHVLLAQVHQFRREFDAANSEADRALALEPKDAVTLANLGSMLRYAGRAKEAATVVERAIRLDPFHPPNYLEWLGDAYLFLGRYRDCVEAVERGTALDPEFVALHVITAECYAAIGDKEKARKAGASILRTNPRFTIRAFASYVPFTQQSDLELKIKLLRQAGIPE